MNNKRYDDELLSAIIDGEADPEIVASVEADPVASARLAQMRRGVLLVAEPPAEASSERRSASIAAALAAATPAPEVTSLAAARHERTTGTKRSAPRRMWLAGVAAAAAFLIAIPIALSLGGDDLDTFATESADDVAEAASAESDAGVTEMADDAAMLTESVADEAMADDAEAGSFNRTEVEEAMADEEAGSPRPNRVVTSDLPTANTVDEIDELLTSSVLTPKFDAQAVIDAGVNEACVQPLDSATAELAYDVLNLDSFGGAARLVIVEFADDGTTRVLDAEDCASLR